MKAPWKRGAFLHSMEQKTIDTLSHAAETITDKSVEFTIDVRPRSQMHALLQRVKLRPIVKKYNIQPIVLGNLQRISRLLLTISPDKQKIQAGELMDEIYRTADQHGRVMAEACAIAIQNNRQEPSKALIAELEDNLTAKEMSTLLAIVVKQMDLVNFMNSIISIRGLNVLESALPNEVSPVDQGR